MAIYKTGLLIIRAWVEKGSAKPLRAHIRASNDVSKGFDSEVTVGDVPAASAKVEAWLEEVLADANATGDEPSGEKTGV
jgi:hypothetical protein